MDSVSDSSVSNISNESFFKSPNSSIKINRNRNIDNNQEDVEDVEQDIVNKKHKDVFVWDPLPQNWQIKLLSKNFLIKNCLDSNYNSLESALQNAGCKTNIDKLKRALCKYINYLDNNSFFKIIQNYRSHKSNINWDPFRIKSKRDFTSQIRRPEFDFRGDNIILSLISKVLNIDIILFQKNLDIINLANNHYTQPKLLILFYDNDENSYKSIGFQSKHKITTIFKRIELPEEISRINNLHLHHIKDICSSKLECKNLELISIINKLQNRLGKQLNSQERQEIFKLIKIILENEKFFTQS